MNHDDPDAWETRLTSEGLGSLDVDLGDDDIGVCNRGSGKILDEEQGRTRAETERARELQQDVARTYKFPTWLDRKIWRRHAAGMSTRDIADDLDVNRNAVRRSIAATETKSSQSRRGSLSREKALCLIKRADPGVLLALARALVRAA